VRPSQGKGCKAFGELGAEAQCERAAAQVVAGVVAELEL